ncbi:MAG: hypothetical protein E6I91_13530 [Chloroflexi bacterium]|nr:MAG: hypothetical protein E6I91_13530 [Chloroflexota bacterium]
MIQKEPGESMAVRRQDFHEDEDDDMGDNAKKRTRITIDVSPEMRRRIKMAALQNDLKVGEYIGRILEENVPDEVPAKRIQGHPVTREAIERLLRFREELIKETNGVLFEDSTEILRQEREKRTRHLMGDELGDE